MDILVTLDNVTLAFGLSPLLDKVRLQINSGERVCLIGRNGAGKSSLLKIIDGSQLPDEGQVHRKPHLKISRLIQELPQDISKTVYEFVAEGLFEVGELLKQYHDLIHKMEHSQDPSLLEKLEHLQHAIDVNNGWQYDQDIKTILTRLELDPDKRISELSGGWQRRVALAQALVTKPELLLLDEPTNHLDIEAIEWLENQLVSWGIGIVFITHDRSLLQRLATRIIELDRGQLTSWPGDYANFLRRKEELLQAEEKLNSEFDKKLAQEEQWIRQGIKARRTRNEGRVRALKAMRLEYSQRQNVMGKATFSSNEAEKSGQMVIEAKNISHAFNEHPIIKDFSIRIMRGARIGLLGPNGVGKSTLLNILLKTLSPQHGEVIHGTKLQIAYFDQLRQALDLEKTVRDNVSPGSDVIEINGSKRHIMSYLSDFLFTPERAMTPVKALSGGECNRLLLARLFSQPYNLLVLDEPTNDLDIETLELLEEILCDYKGTLLIVSHDRAFLDNVVTSILAFHGQGKIEEYIGGYQDYLRQVKTTKVKEPATTTKIQIESSAQKTKTTKKLSNKEQRELEQLLKQIATLEAAQQTLQELIGTPDFYQKPSEEITKTMMQIKDNESALQKAYQRWEELEI